MAARADAGTIASHFERVLRLSPQAIALSYADTPYTWEALGQFGRHLAKALAHGGVAAGAPAAWVARNDPSSAAGALALLLSRNCIMPVNPHRSGLAVAEEVRELEPAFIIAVKEDWTEALLGVAGEIGAIGLEADLNASEPVRIILSPGASPPRWTARPNVIMERVTSGTTGPPKRIPIDAATFITAFEFLAPNSSDRENAPSVAKQSPSFVFASLAHSAGLWHMLAAFFHARPVVLHAKFTVEGLCDSMRCHRPKTLKLTPAMVSMIVQEEPPREDFASLIAIRTGSAPLDPGVRKAFQDRYGVPILVDYGASEFMGGIATWSLDDWRRFGTEKSTSVGRLRTDMQARVIDPDTGEAMPVGDIGVLCLNTPRAGGDWVRTTDLASLDADGFVYLHGRADEAINRGGFKVLPEKVAEVIRQHRAVRDAIVLGIKDKRLGEAPIAVVELVPDHPPPNAEELKDLVRAQLPPYFVPVAVEFCEALPRNASTKVDRPAVRALLSGRYKF